MITGLSVSAAALHDRLDLLQVVDVERRHAVAVFGGVVEQLAHRNEGHGGLLPGDWHVIGSPTPVALCEHRDGRQRLAFEELEERAAAGRDVARSCWRCRTCRSRPACRRRRRSRTRCDAAIASASALVPSANASNSNTPTGPFQTMVPALAMIVFSAAIELGPMSRIRSSGSTFSIAFESRPWRGRELLGARPRRRGSAPRPGIHASRIACASPTRSASASDLADRGRAGGQDEGVGDAAADDQLVDLGGQRLQHGELGRDLRAGDDGDQRPLRVARAPCRGRRARRPAAARRRRSARYRAMPCVVASARCAVPKASLHVDVAERRHLPRELLVVLLLALVEAAVLEQHDLRRPSAACHAPPSTQSRDQRHRHDRAARRAAAATGASESAALQFAFGRAARGAR